MPITKKGYSLLGDRYYDEVDLDSSSSTNGTKGITHTKRSSGRRGRIAIALNVVLFCLSVMLASWTLVTLRWNGGIKNRPRRQVNVHSPMLDQLDLPYVTKKINGTLLDMDKSIYRQPPSPEVDAAWAHLSSLRTVHVSSADLVKMGKDPTKTAKYPEYFGLGDDAYAAEVDVLHKIHCLNALRRDIYFDYYFRDKYPDGRVSELHATHTSHCLYVLLQNLMCDANTDMVPQVWVEGQLHPFPDFSINRKCGDIEAIVGWQREHAVDEAKYMELRRPSDHAPVPMSDEFKRMFGVEGWEEHHSHAPHAGMA